MKQNLLRVDLIIRKHLHLILVILVALQSITVLAEASQDHESGAGQFELIYDHSVVPELDPHSDASVDCHHCFHCPILMAEIDSALRVNQFISPIDQNRPLYFSRLISPDLRPPIV